MLITMMCSRTLTAPPPWLVSAAAPPGAGALTTVLSLIRDDNHATSPSQTSILRLVIKVVATCMMLFLRQFM